MATVKQGTFAKPPELWKHLRDLKRVVNRRERRAAVRDIGTRLKEVAEDVAEKSRKPVCNCGCCEDSR